MSRPGTFERVYASIREQLRRGEFRPGERLEPAILSDELNASVTPVRDALHRLTGERLVEAPRHEGFRVPLMTETMLRHLYAWHRDLVMLAVLSHRIASDAEALGTSADHFAEEPFRRQNALFVGLARLSGNPEHVAALESVMNRLAPVQRLEAKLLDELEEETNEILAALKSNHQKDLRRALSHYHRRRARIVPQLLEQLYAA